MIHYISAIGIGQPWVGNELRIVSRAGVPFTLHALRRPEHTHFESGWADELNRATEALYPLPWGGMLLSALLAPALFGARFLGALANALFGQRENLRGRVAGLAHLFVACHWARRLRRRTLSHIHSQWAHSPATVGMYGAWLLGVSFSFTGHASDIFRNRVALTEKIRRADFIICISTFHRDFFRKHGARDDQLHIAYCGIDPELFAPCARQRDARAPLRILASGRLVEKKGFEYLIDACKILAEGGRAVECVIGGSGPLEDELRARARALGLADRVRVTGQPINQEDLPGFMAAGDAYCLPCVWARDNDVDGLPQMLMEAMACGLPVVSTRLVGIPDLVIDGETGLLVEPRNAGQLADALGSLIDDPDRAARLAEAGRRWVTDKFDIASSLDPLLELLRSRTEQARGAAAIGDGASGSSSAAARAGVAEWSSREHRTA